MNYCKCCGLLSSMSILAASSRFCRLFSVSVCLSLRRFSCKKKLNKKFYIWWQFKCCVSDYFSSTDQDLHWRWLDGDVYGVQIGLLDVFHSLYVNIQDADEVLCLNVLNGWFAACNRKYDSNYFSVVDNTFLNLGYFCPLVRRQKNYNLLYG